MATEVRDERNFAMGKLLEIDTKHLKTIDNKLLKGKKISLHINELDNIKMHFTYACILLRIYD